ncbi:MAG: hypothetical protein R2741_10385 [Methanolobus sp.]
MKFIERLFGKKQEKEESHPAVFKFKDIFATVKSEIKKQENELKPVVKEKYDGIRKALSELDTLKKDLMNASPIENVSKRGEKLGDSNRDNVANNIKLIHDKLKVPGNTSPVAAYEYYMDAKSSLKTMMDNTRKSLMYIKALYPQEHQKINQGLAELEDSIDGLYSSIASENQRITELEKVSAETENIRRIQDDLESSKKKMIKLESRYETAKEKLSDGDTRLVELENSSEFDRANEIEAEIKNLDKKIYDISTEARRLFTPLSKAISRMEKQDENGRCVLSPENRELLHSIKDDPAQAIERDMSAFLTEMTNRIDSGDLGLKDQMCDKALNQIQVLADKKTISALIEQKKEAFAEKEKLEDELNTLSIYRQRDEIEREMEEHRSYVSSANNDLDSERRHMDILGEEMEDSRSVLLSGMKHIFGNDCVIEYEE